MSNVPANLKYTESHEWVRVEADGTVTIGITDHAQEALGDLVFVELPDVGKTYAAGQETCVVESVKAAADVYAPIAGEVTARNQDAVDAPESCEPGRLRRLAVQARSPTLPMSTRAA